MTETGELECRRGEKSYAVVKCVDIWRNTSGEGDSGLTDAERLEVATGLDTR